MTTPLSRPANPQVKVDPNPQECLAEGLNYPTFRLLNKKSRVTLSPNYLSADPAFTYQNFAVANKKGWFAAIQNAGSFGIILSPLSQLRTSIKDCSGDETHLQPQRVLSFSNNEPNIVAFACNDSRLIVGFKSGQIVSYDTATICTQGTNEITPLNFLQQSTSPPIQIQPNHSSDPALADLVAVVRKDGNVELLNTTLERQHGWNPGDASSTPVAVSWSTKGKQLAIGLALGDIMTFSLANKTTHQRHIPPTADGILVSLNWLAPGHTFRTSYSPPTPGSDDPVHHILHQDAKTSPVQYTKLDHSFQAPDRTKQSAYVVVLPKWDEDHTNSNPDESKLLVVVGDVSCTDLEILGNQGTQWYQQSQDNPLSIPLDKNTEDTILLALDADLTDTEAGYPVMYAYLNDGTVQAWYVDGSKTYAGMIGGDIGVVATSTSSTTPSAFGGTSTQPASVFGQTSSSPATSPFGQPAGSSPSPFGAPTGGSAFGQSSFGQSSNTASPFGAGNQTSSSPFGQTTSAFGSQTQSASPFGGPSQQGSSFGGASSQTPSAFGAQSSSPSAFGGQSQPTSAFGGGSTFSQSSFGQSGFGQSGFGQKSPSPFGGTNSTTPGSSGGGFSAFGNTATPSPFGASFGAAATTATSPPITRDDSMGDSTPSFGGLSLGGSNTNNEGEKKTSAFGAGGGMFGSGANQPAASPFGGSSDSSSSSGLIKPASGFGAFGGGGGSSGSFGSSTTPSAFSGGAFGAKTDQPATNAFSSGAFSAKPATPPATNTGGGGFGQSSFGQSSFGQSGFGQSGFGQSAFGKPAPAPAPAPASTPASSAGGFSAFASSGTSSFGSAASGGAKPAFGGGGETSGVFGGAKSETSSVFGSKTSENKPTSGGFGAFSGQPSAFGSTSNNGSAFGSKPAETSSVFGNKSDAKPATGFGAFAGQPSAFGATTTGTGSFGSSAFGSTPSGQSAFGSTSTSSPKPESDAKPSKPAGLSGPPSPNSPSPSPPPIASTPASPSTTPAPATGAFSNLTRSTFKPSEGFGAFGSAISSDSPFFKASNEKKEPAVTAFGGTSSNAPSTPTSSPSTAAPAFGSTSKLGFGFGAKTPTPTASTPAFGTPTSSGGFSTFSSGTSSFGSFASGNKPTTSFGDLLKSGGDGPKKEDRASVFVEKPKAEGEGKGQEKALSEDDKGKEKEKSTEPPAERPITPKTESNPATPKPLPPKTLKEEEKTPSLFGSSVFTPPEKPKSTEPPTPPAESTPSSQSSSYVDIRKSEAGSEAGSDVEEPPDDEEGFLTDSYGSRSEGEEASEDEGGPSNRSRSGTPHAGPPERASPSTHEPEVYDDDYEDEEEEDEEDEEEEGELETDDDATSDTSRLSTINEESETTTPPGSPEKKETRQSPSASPAPTSPSPLLGIGRPSTRPSRSSPLAASAPLSGYDEETDPATPTAKEQPQLFSGNKPRPASPKTPFGTPTAAPTPSAPAEESKTTKRPKTPPLLSNFGLGGNSAPNKPSLFGQPSAPAPLFGGQPSTSSTTPSLVASTTPPAIRPTTAPPGPSPVARSPFGTPGPSGAPAPLTTGVSPASGPASAPAGGLFGKPPPVLVGGLLGQPPAPIPIKKEESTPPLGSMFSMPPPRPMTMPPPQTMPPPSQSMTTAAPPFPGGGLFGAPPAGLAQRPPVPFGTSVPQPTSVQPPQPTQPPIPSPNQFQEGMQRECAMLYANMIRELEELRRMAESASKRREELRKIGGGSKRKEDLGDASKWGLCDAPQMSATLLQYEKDVRELKEGTQKQKQSIGELNKSMIKAGTRREEIARFNKAKSDNEFVKMLKSRTLGPEHLETQTQLRRNIRNLSTRVEQLEDQLKSHKKKIAEYNSGRPFLRAPTIDTINRTYRNIDIAIQQQADDIAGLTARTKKMNLSSLPLPRQKTSLGERDPRLPDPVRRPFTVTPDVAVTTAAALNAERYAHKLKTALLSARKEPLLNTTAAKAMTTSDVPVAFSTPGKKTIGGTGFQFNTPIQGALFGTPSPTAEIPNAEHFPEDHFSPSTPLGNSRRGGPSKRSHAPAVALRKSPAGGSLPEGAGLGSPPVGFGSPSPAPNALASPSPAFNWGPLPSFNQSKTPSLFAPISFGKKPEPNGKS
ncbi:hypothetical protein AAF712_009365 [Marasmius tenuissimus]|uniref:Nucleoporin Nup159/Nup146 N-terminal domain-containing protein n=1 Tax=Marasmius tenuissimus TaxID=585030 RepID=A0ABR2ZQN0_9AGAR